MIASNAYICSFFLTIYKSTVRLRSARKRKRKRKEKEGERGRRAEEEEEEGERRGTRKIPRRIGMIVCGIVWFC